MLNSPLKLILCDLGNVLINFDHWLAVEKILAFTDKNLNEIYQFFFDSPLTEQYETGKISSRVFFENLTRDLAVSSLSYQAFVDIWNEIFFENKEMTSFLAGLKPRYRLHLLSNINELHCDYVRRAFPESLAIFDGLFFSHEIGYRKPHLQTYKRSVMDCGYAPEETLYIDDREDLICEAQKLKMRGVVFKGVASLRASLKKEGVLV